MNVQIPRKMDALGTSYMYVNLMEIKGTTRGLNGIFLPLVMNPLCPLKYYDRSTTVPWFAMAIITHLYGKKHSGGSVMLLDPWMSP